MIEDNKEVKRISLFDNFDMKSVKDLSNNGKCHNHLKSQVQCK